MRSSGRAVLLAVVALCLLGRDARASEYPGWGDTGWSYDNKRDCCHGAIDIAAQYSAQACENSGGMPSQFAGVSQRGTCTAQWMQAADGGLIYRCHGEASVWCN